MKRRVAQAKAEGLTVGEAVQALRLPRSTVKRLWNEPSQ